MSHRDGIATGFGRGMLAGGATLALIAGLAFERTGWGSG